MSQPEEAAPEEALRRPPREGLESCVDADGPYWASIRATPQAAGRQVWGPPFPERRQLGPRAIDDPDARDRLDRLPLSQELEETGPVGPTCFGPRIRGEPFTKGFTLPRDTPKYNDTVKLEDRLTN